MKPIMLARRAATGVLVGFALLLSGCATHYVDNSVKEVPVASFRAPASPQPTQFFFEFQTRGVANAHATQHLKARVKTQVEQSGLFRPLTDTPAPGGQMVSVTVNNVPLSDDAFSKGFATGLTFGLIGSEVSDGYVCTIRYSSRAGDPIVKNARHAIYTTLGAASAPKNAIAAKDVDEAVTLMLRQVISTALHELSQDPNFR